MSRFLRNSFCESGPYPSMISPRDIMDGYGRFPAKTVPQKPCQDYVYKRTAPPVYKRTAPPVYKRTAPPVYKRTAPPVYKRTAPPVYKRTAPPVGPLSTPAAPRRRRPLRPPRASCARRRRRVRGIPRGLACLVFVCSLAAFFAVRKIVRVAFSVFPASP